MNLKPNIIHILQIFKFEDIKMVFKTFYRVQRSAHNLKSTKL
jgi:hypothetical protein